MAGKILIARSGKMLLLLVLLGYPQWAMFKPIEKTTNELPVVDRFYGCSNVRPQLTLTVNSLARISNSGIITERLLEINWFNIENKPGDIVALYNRDPSTEPSDPLDSALVASHPDNYYLTKIIFPRIRFTKLNLSSNCLGFWGAYMRDQTIIAVSCIRARPFWMEDHAKELRELNLTSLMIPGSHDAGSYQFYKGRKSENILDRYIYAQEEDIFHQLVYGIRHLDLRVGHYENEPSKFYINHSFFRTPNTLEKVLKDIKRFLKVAKKEIIILDFHQFPVGFDGATIPHNKAIEIIETELGPYMVPSDFGYGSNFGQILESGKRVIIGYNAKQRIGNKNLWPEIKQKWGNQQEINGLFKYLERTYSGDVPGMLWSAMAELTPTPASIVLQPKEGLRVLANLVNRNVTRWYQNEKWTQKSNIVATDFFLGNNIINIAIETNVQKFTCKKA